jgi:hypothetical protein
MASARAVGGDSPTPVDAVDQTESVTNAGLPSDYTAGAGYNGVPSFSAALNTVAIQAIRVTDTDNSTIWASSIVDVGPTPSAGGSSGSGERRWRNRRRDCVI